MFASRSLSFQKQSIIFFWVFMGNLTVPTYSYSGCCKKSLENFLIKCSRIVESIHFASQCFQKQSNIRMFELGYRPMCMAESLACCHKAHTAHSKGFQVFKWHIVIICLCNSSVLQKATLE